MKFLFLGMGTMGGPMAANLVKQHEVHVWNRSRDSEFLAMAVNGGCRSLDELAELGDYDAVMVCLPDSPEVNDVLFGGLGVAQELAAKSLIIDFTTLGQSPAKEIALKLAKHDIDYIDAPVTGGDVGAINGTLSFFVGCKEDQLSQLQPMLLPMGSNVFHCGEVGMGQAMKLVNQELCAVNMVAVTEAYLLSQSLGLDFKKVSEFCSTGAAGSWALQNLGPQIADANTKPGFKVSLMLKDLRLVQNEGDSRALEGFSYAMQKFQEIPTDHGEVGTQAMFMSYKKD